jgi:hypothetical protein
MTAVRNTLEYPGPEVIPVAPWIGLLPTRLGAPDMLHTIPLDSRRLRLVDSR